MKYGESIAGGDIDIHLQKAGITLKEIKMEDCSYISMKIKQSLVFLW